MLVKDMVALADIWRVIADDPGTTLIGLTLDPVSVSFAGTHCEAVAGTPGDQSKMAVLGARLRGVLSLLDPEAELSMIHDISKGRLVLKTRGRIAELAVVAEGAAEGMGFHEGSRGIPTPKQQTFPIDPLVRAFSFLQTCVGTQPSMPLLTGIKMSHDKKGALLLAATDREAHTGLVRLTGTKPKTRIQGEVVVPVKEVLEFLAFAKGMEATDVTVDISFPKARFAAAGAVLSVSCLQGANPFPNLGQLPTTRQYARAVQISPDFVVEATKASILLDADRVVRLAIKNGRAALIVQGQETGSFRALVPAEAVGTLAMDDCDLLFDAHWLAPVEHLGTTAVLYYMEGSASLFIGENGYRLWMALLTRA